MQPLAFEITLGPVSVGYGARSEILMHLENRFGSLKPVLRIRNVFPRSQIRFFPFRIPDSGLARSRILIRIQANHGSWIWIHSTV
jgi:hypothetical protein